MIGHQISLVALGSGGAGLFLALAAASAAPLCPVPSVGIEHGSGAPTGFSRVDLTDKNAVCNDGSPGAYFIEPGVGAAAHRWVVLLQGGGACTGISRSGKTGPDACSGRDALVKVRNLTKDPKGLLSDAKSENRDFYDATKVFVSYCSSDYWSGATITPKDPSGFNIDDYNTWSFAGRAILAATLTDVLAKATAETLPTEVLYTGTSAGGLGVIETAGDAAARFAALPAPPRFVAAADAGYGIDVFGYDSKSQVPPYQSDSKPFEASLATGAGIWGGRGDVNCVAASDHSTQALLNCRKPEFILSQGYITVPLLLEQSRMDTAQLGDNGVVFSGSGANECTAPKGFAGKNPATAMAYARCFAYQMQSSIATNAIGPNAPRISAFAPDQVIHVESTCSALFNTQRMVESSEGTVALSDQQAIGTWYRHPCTDENWQEVPLNTAADCAQSSP